MIEQLIPLREIHCYFGTDTMGRNFVAGKSGSGKSTVLRGITFSQQLFYIGEEHLKHFTFPMTCQDLLDTLQMSGEVKGIVLDFPSISEKLTDFKDYKWNIKIWYSLQLNRKGDFNNKDIIDYRIPRPYVNTEKLQELR